MKNENISQKSRLVAFLFCTFLGTIGAHRFYAGKIGTGILQLLTGGGLGLWTLYDWVIILLGKFQDNKGKEISNWTD